MNKEEGDEESSERIISIVRLVSDDFAVTKAAADRFQPDRQSSSLLPLLPPVTKTLYPSSAGITRLRFCITDFKETTYTVKCTNITSRGVESVSNGVFLFPSPSYRDIAWGGFFFSRVVRRNVGSELMNRNPPIMRLRLHWLWYDLATLLSYPSLRPPSACVSIDAHPRPV